MFLFHAVNAPTPNIQQKHFFLTAKGERPNVLLTLVMGFPASLIAFFLLYQSVMNRHGLHHKKTRLGLISRSSLKTFSTHVCPLLRSSSCCLRFHSGRSGHWSGLSILGVTLHGYVIVLLLFTIKIRRNNYFYNYFQPARAACAASKASSPSPQLDPGRTPSTAMSLTRVDSAPCARSSAREEARILR